VTGARDGAECAEHALQLLSIVHHVQDERTSLLAQPLLGLNLQEMLRKNAAKVSVPKYVGGAK
jgi:hypothetical protein